jgi:rhodanese-related sulfurtransferase
VKTYLDFVRDAKTRIREIDPAEARARFDADDGCVFLDVRERDELAKGTVPGAIVMPRGLLEGHAAESIPSLDFELIVLCDKGNRSALAAVTLHEIGFTRVTSLAGGLLAWIAAGHPVGEARTL